MEIACLIGLVVLLFLVLVKGAVDVALSLITFLSGFELARRSKSTSWPVLFDFKVFL